MTRALGLALALALGACTTPPGADVGPPPDRDARRDRLNRAETFAAVLSRRAALDSLAGYDLVIVDPDAYQVEDVRELRAGGALSLGYVNVGEAEAWRGFADRIDPAWVLGENANWPGHQFVDARQPGWQELVVETVAGRVVAREFDGLFLDMADVAAPSLYPETAPGVVALVQALRERYPTHLIVMNRGLFLTDRVGHAIDGLLVEGVWGRMDFRTRAPARTRADETQALLARLAAFRDETGGATFAIDYADTDALRDHVRASARRAGLPVFVSRIALADLPPAQDARAW